MIPLPKSCNRHHPAVFRHLIIPLFIGGLPMRKCVLFLMITLSSITIFSACSSGDQSGTEHIIRKTIKASEEVNSFAANINMKQEVSVPEFAEPLSFELEATADIQTEPFTFHQQVSSMGDTFEMYYTEDGFFIQDPDSKEWVQTSNEWIDQISQWSQVQVFPAARLKELEEYIQDFEIEEKENHYVLTLSSSGDDVTKLAKDVLAQNGFTEGLEEVFQDISVDHLSYTFHINKQTHLPESTEMSMELEVKQQGKTSSSTIIQKLKASYGKFNEIEDIQVPE